MSVPTDWVFGKRLLVRFNIVWMDRHAKRMGGWLCYWIGWQCQPIESLATHIVRVFGSANWVCRWMRTLFEGLAVPIECVAGCARCTADYGEAGCAHCSNGCQWQLLRGWLCTCLNRWLLQLSGWLCQLAERPPAPTGRIEMPVPDFEHTLHEPVYAGRHAWGNFCM